MIRQQGLCNQNWNLCTSCETSTLSSVGVSLVQWCFGRNDIASVRLESENKQVEII